MPRLGTEFWSGVRYTAPLAGIGVAAGLVGLGRSALLINREGSRWVSIAGRIGLVAVAAEGLYASRAAIEGQPPTRWRGPSRSRKRRASGPGSGVGPDDGVLADYVVAAPAPPAQILRSYTLETEKPWGFPSLGPDFRWVFANAEKLDPKTWTDQGFRVVHRGETIWVYYRPDPSRGIHRGWSVAWDGDSESISVVTDGLRRLGDRPGRPPGQADGDGRPRGRACARRLRGRPPPALPLAGFSDGSPGGGRP